MSDRPAVLVVDDDPDFCAYLRRILLRVGYEVLEAGDAWTALALLAKRRPAMVCLDLMLPGLSGFELCERIRKDPAWRGLPVLAISARTHPQDVALARSVGADAVLGKPVHMARLCSTVEALLEKRHEEAR